MINFLIVVVIVIAIAGGVTMFIKTLAGMGDGGQE